MADPGTFWKRAVISLTERITNLCASWNSMFSSELLKIDIAMGRCGESCVSCGFQKFWDGRHRGLGIEMADEIAHT
jgi:hypothetical protein